MLKNNKFNPFIIGGKAAGGAKSKDFISRDFTSKGFVSQGFTLVEALVATAIIGIGFTGAFTLAATSQQFNTYAVKKQKLQMQVDQIFTVIESDIANIDDYDAIDMSTCTEPLVSQTETQILREYEWCMRMNGEVGAVANGEIRTIDITTLADGRKVAHVQLEANSGNVQLVAKKVYNAE